MVETPRPYGVRAINGLVQVVHGVLRFARVSLHDPRDRLVVRPDNHEVLQRELGDVGLNSGRDTLTLGPRSGDVVMCRLACLITHDCTTI